MTGVLVACPVAQRDWIIRHWADHAVAACERASAEPSFLLAAHPTDPTPAVLLDHLGSSCHLTVVPTPGLREEDRRDWQPTRYDEMAAIRNVMLGKVREMAPPLLLSVDSDVLLHPDALVKMLELVGDFDAVGSACFLSRPPRRRADGVIGMPSWVAPNFAMLDRAERLMREWQPAFTRRVDVLMALKLMKPRAYHVDYEGHYQGEDIGWGLACRRAGLRLGWTSTVVSKHVMDSHCEFHVTHDPSCAGCLEPLSRPDPRCGY